MDIPHMKYYTTHQNSCSKFYLVSNIHTILAFYEHQRATSWGPVS
jgi:hypothetical protein